MSTASWRADLRSIKEAFDFRHSLAQHSLQDRIKWAVMCIGLRFKLLTLVLVLTADVSRAEEREQFRETVTIDYVTNDPCQRGKLRIKGKVVLDGYYKDVEEGYFFSGEADYSNLTAASIETNRVYKARQAPDDVLKMTVDIPFDRTVTQNASFYADDEALQARFTFKLSVGFFGDKDIDLTEVRTSCIRQ